MPLMSAAQGTWPTNQRVDRHPGIADDPQAGMHPMMLISGRDLTWVVCRALPLPPQRQQPSCHLRIHLLLLYDAD